MQLALYKQASTKERETHSLIRLGYGQPTKLNSCLIPRSLRSLSPTRTLTPTHSVAGAHSRAHAAQKNPARNFTAVIDVLPLRRVKVPSARKGTNRARPAKTPEAPAAHTVATAGLVMGKTPSNRAALAAPS